jgi:hypothetical protein
MNNVVSKLDSIFLQYKERKQFLERSSIAALHQGSCRMSELGFAKKTVV